MQIVGHRVKNELATQTLPSRSLELTGRFSALINVNSSIQSFSCQALSSGVLEIFYSDTDPGRAQMLVNRLSEVYVVYKRDRLARRAGATVKFISGEIARINAELEEAEAELVAYQEDSGATLLSENGLALVQQISELDLERARLGMSLQSHSVVMGQLKLAEVPVESIVGSIELRPLADSMFRSLIEAQKMVSELSVEYTDAWPELAEARERVEELRTAIMLHLEAQMAGLESRDEDLAEIIGGYGDLSVSTNKSSQKREINLMLGGCHCVSNLFKLFAAKRAVKFRPRIIQVCDLLMC